MFVRFPFNPKTPIGFFVAFILQCIVLWHAFIFCTIMASFGINAFIFGIATTKLLKHALDHTNKSGKIEKNRLSAAKELTEFVELQSSAKQLSFFKKFNYPVSHFVFRKLLIFNRVFP